MNNVDRKVELIIKDGEYEQPLLISKKQALEFIKVFLYSGFEVTAKFEK